MLGMARIYSRSDVPPLEMVAYSQWSWTLRIADEELLISPSKPGKSGTKMTTLKRSLFLTASLMRWTSASTTLLLTAFPAELLMKNWFSMYMNFRALRMSSKYANWMDSSVYDSEMPIDQFEADRSIWHCIVFYWLVFEWCEREVFSFGMY